MGMSGSTSQSGHPKDPTSLTAEVSDDDMEVMQSVPVMADITTQWNCRGLMKNVDDL